MSSISLLHKLLEKRGIEKVEDLSPEEFQIFERYRMVLTGSTVTLDQVKEFCHAQIAIIEAKCDGITPLTSVQQACLHVYINILKAIEAPEAERTSLERHLNQLITA